MNDTQIVFDIGATNMRVARVQGSTLVHVQKALTPEDLEEAARAIVRMAGGWPFSKVAGCMPGNIDADGVLSDARNLPRWEGKNIHQIFKTTFGIPVALENDCGLAGLGEAAYGAGKGYPVVAYLTVSTGVGGARIADGRIDHAAYSFRPGHIPVGGTDLEDSISGMAIKRRYNIEPMHMTDMHVLEYLAALLAEGVVQTVGAWKPDVVVIGGSMILGTNPIPLHDAEQRVSIPIKKAALGDEGGLYGALAYVRMTSG